MFFYLALFSIVGWILFIARVTGLDEKILNKYRTRNRAKNAYAGKKIVISGASSGIGAEMAKQYASLGATLFIGARREEMLSEVSKACESAGSRCGFYKLDVTDANSCTTFIQEAIKYLGGIDLLVLNAGVGCVYELSQVKNLDDHKKLMNVNFWGCAQLTLDSLAELKKSKGQIAVVSSLSGKLPVPNRTAYCASKFALHGFFGALRLEMAPYQVKVSILCPGYVMTDFQQSSIGAANVHKNESQFMSVKDCVRELIDAVEDQKAEHVMTLKGNLATKLMPLLPSSWIDALIIKTAKSAATYKQ